MTPQSLREQTLFVLNKNIIYCNIIFPNRTESITFIKVLLLSRSRLFHYSVGGAWWHLYFYESFSTLCGRLAQRQGWRVKGEYDRVRNRDRLKLTPDLITRWATGNDIFVYLSLWDFKSSLTCRKILWHGTFPLYFPSERKVCCGFLSPILSY
jgi:hypothetical protein